MLVQVGLKQGTKFIYPVNKNGQNKCEIVYINCTHNYHNTVFMFIHLLFGISGQGKISLSIVDLH